ncbi:MAG: DoxX family protein [Longimicrobiaceae bacterium]
MSIFEPAPPPWPGRVLSIVRIVLGAVFITFGTMKLCGVPPLPPGVTIPIWSQAWIGGVLEVVGGFLIVLGLFTRPTAFILSGEMAVAYWQFHAPQSPWPSVNMGAPAILYCFLFLYMAFAGGGPWSLDALIARRRGEAAPTS